MQRTLLFAQFTVVALLTAIHIAALSNDLYWTLPWLDLATHFLGGTWAALFYYWLKAIFMRTPTPFQVTALVIVLGIAWEVFELSVGISAGAGYALDTFSDLLMDIVGAASVALSMKYIFTPSLARSSL